MKLYRHYKNKDYTYRGLVKHSETLEELALYECRYENPSGKLWVRPKGMFFENVKVKGKTQARFAKIPLRIKTSTKVSKSKVAELSPLIKNILGEWDPKWFHGHLKNHKNFHLLIAYVDKKAVGFKLGYELDSFNFYSWLGGVLPEYRDLGIATDLMKAQHEWCRKQGYRKVQTKTVNKYKEMLILNLQNGFEVIGTHLSNEGGFKIVLEKTL
jgi:GNAT superfamily N-acetyltransferase